ncbi:hypothetical protein [Aliivibrio fischeri]|uniref:hypothetical protein n=1 Tax=Aliivibrio fischeri TaxID=668 RepID=UPI0012DA6C64|nr:hypothetical protein [Aliivibrio fischeri]MUL11523.1 hypothetical protein [Aliivibrio fischeri]MUL15430.1 hypothetical protein [Aliivibrio fischeri]
MNPKEMTNDEFKPACHKCGNTNFIAMTNGYVARADLSIGMIICSKEDCQTVVGCLPHKDIWQA